MKLSISTKTKSPLKDSPLRNPGESLDEEIQRKIDDEASLWLIFSLFLVLLTAFEWYRWYAQVPYSPWVFTIVAIPVATIAFFKLRRIRTEIRRLKLGRDGEKAVGQFLEGLRAKGYKVFHDIVGEGFNLDHVVIGPTGIYSVETKTHNKLSRGDQRIAFDGTTIKKDGREMERDPVIQARAQAKWLTEILEASSGRKAAVKPVILFPGWFVEPSGKTDIWVLEPKAFVKFLDHEDRKISDEDVHLFSFHLSRFIRSAAR